MTLREELDALDAKATQGDGVRDNVFTSPVWASEVDLPDTSNQDQAPT